MTGKSSLLMSLLRVLKCKRCSLYLLYWYLKSGVFRVPGLLFEYIVVADFRVEEVGKE